MKHREGEGSAQTRQYMNAPAIPAWLVWCVALGLVLGGIGSFGILDNNEGLYAEIPREMLASGDWHMWVIPHLNGLPYMEKPPLLYWLTAMSFALFGESEWSARLVPALSSLSCVWMLLWFGRAAGHRLAGRLAALMFVSGLGVMAMSHVLMFDMLLTALLTAALMLAWRSVAERRPALLRGSYAFLAAAVLTKGFVALVLFGLVAFAFTASHRQGIGSFLRDCAAWFEWRALLVFIIIAAPWHVAASLTEPIFAWFYFVNEHVLRFLGKREPHDYYSGAWWYYLPRMAIYLFPWSFLVIPVVFRRAMQIREEGSLKRFLFLAWLLPLAFFSVSSAKANYYLVAVMPFAAFHLALAIEERGWLRPASRALPGLLIAILASILLAVIVVRGIGGERQLVVMGLPQQQFVCVMLAVTLALALLGSLGAWRFARIGLLAYLPLPVWTGVALVMALHAMEPAISTRQLAQYLQQNLAGRSVYLYRNFEEQSSLPFYLKHPVPIVDARSNDLFWGNRLRVNDIIISPERFSREMLQKPVAIVVLQRQLAEFRQAYGTKFKDEKRIGDSTVFSN